MHGLDAQQLVLARLILVVLDAGASAERGVVLGEPQLLLLEKLLLRRWRHRWCCWWWCGRRRKPRGAELERGAPHLGLQVVLGLPHLGLQVILRPLHLGPQVEHNPQLLVSSARVVLVQRGLRRDPRGEEIHHGDAGAQVIQIHHGDAGAQVVHVGAGAQGVLALASSDEIQPRGEGAQVGGRVAVGAVGVQVVVLATSSWGKSMAAACLVLLLELWNEVLGVHATISLAGRSARRRDARDQRVREQGTHQTKKAMQQRATKEPEGGSPQTPRGEHTTQGETAHRETPPANSYSHERVRVHLALTITP